MAKVTGQDTEHPLYSLLAKFVGSRKTNGVTYARLWTPTQSRRDYSNLLGVCWAILRRGVKKWQALSQEEKDYYDENHPPFLDSGYIWYLWLDIIENYGGGPWKVGASEVQGHSYLPPHFQPEGCKSRVYVGATFIGCTSVIISAEEDWSI